MIKFMRVAIPLALMVLAMGACSGVSDSATDVEQPGPELFDRAVVSVTGKVVPVNRAELSFRMSGVVGEVLVIEGEQVTEGQVLIRLDAPELPAAVTQAEATVQAAEAELALLQAGASTQDLAVAEAAVSVAAENVRAAEQSVAIAEAGVSNARAALQGSQASLSLVEAGARPEEIEVARQQLEQAKSQLYALQAQRDTVGGREGKPGYDASAYEALQGQVFAAEDAVEIAQLNLSIAEQGARPEEVAGAEAQLAATRAVLMAAQAELAAAQQNVLTAQAQEAQARAELTRIAAAARPEQLAVAKAAVAQAQAALESARAAAGQAELIAPFGGTVARLDARVGELAMPGVALVALGDFSELIVETTDLDEIDVARVGIGSRADIELDALAAVELKGTVESIAPMAGRSSGGTTFTARLTLDEQPPELRWGMTAFVDIEAE